MKRILIGISLMAMLSFTACGEVADSPEKVVMQSTSMIESTTVLNVADSDPMEVTLETEITSILSDSRESSPESSPEASPESSPEESSESSPEESPESSPEESPEVSSEAFNSVSEISEAEDTDMQIKQSVFEEVQRLCDFYCNVRNKGYERNEDYYKKAPYDYQTILDCPELETETSFSKTLLYANSFDFFVSELELSFGIGILEDISTWNHSDLDRLVFTSTAEDEIKFAVTDINDIEFISVSEDTCVVRLYSIYKNELGYSDVTFTKSNNDWLAQNSIIQSRVIITETELNKNINNWIG